MEIMKISANWTLNIHGIQKIYYRNCSQEFYVFFFFFSNIQAILATANILCRRFESDQTKNQLFIQFDALPWRRLIFDWHPRHIHLTIESNMNGFEIWNWADFFFEKDWFFFISFHFSFKPEWPTCAVYVFSFYFLTWEKKRKKKNAFSHEIFDNHW